MKIIKLSEEACHALEQLGVPFEQIADIQQTRGYPATMGPDMPRFEFYAPTDDDVDAIIEGGDRAKNVLKTVYQRALEDSVRISTAILGQQPIKPIVRPPPVFESPDSQNVRPNPKKVGRENRNIYLEHLTRNGVALKHEHRTAYVTSRGNRVVLALANHPFRLGKWFLGAPKKFFDKPNTALVLICKEGEKFLDFVFPPAEVHKLVPMLTEVAGELRFNVRRDDGVHYLYRPGVDKMEISHLLGNYTPLKSL